MDVFFHGRYTSVPGYLAKTSVNTGIQKPVKMINKTKAAFKMKASLYKELMVFAAQLDKKMVEVVEQATRKYIDT